MTRDQMNFSNGWDDDWPSEATPQTTEIAGVPYTDDELEEMGLRAKGGPPGIGLNFDPWSQPADEPGARRARGSADDTQSPPPPDWTRPAGADTSVTDEIYQIIESNRGAWEQRLKDAATASGVPYAPSDLEDVIRQLRTQGNEGIDPSVFLNQAIARYQARASNRPEPRDPRAEPSPGESAATTRGVVTPPGRDEEQFAASGWPTFTPPAALTLPEPFSYPEYVPPDPFAYDPYTPAEQFAYDPYVAPEPFAYEDFEAPTGETMLVDPSYQFRLSEGQRALDASAAARGTLRTGGHLQDTLGYGQQFASQEYGNIYDRATQQYDVNRRNALQNYLTNEGTRASVYDRNLGLARSTFDVNEALRSDAWRQNYGVASDIYGINAAGQLGAYDVNRQLAQDAWQSQYKTAGDLFGSQYMTAQDKYAADQRQAELQFGREWDAYTFDQNQDYRYWSDQLRADMALANYGTRV